MAEDRIHLQITTAAGVKYDKMVGYVSVPLQGGSVGVLANHAPLLAAVIDGTVKCTYGDSETDYIYVGNGVADIVNNEVNILVRDAETADDIDYERAASSENRARERLNGNAEEYDHARAVASLSRALPREKTYKFKNSK